MLCLFWMFVLIYEDEFFFIEIDAFVTDLTKSLTRFGYDFFEIWIFAMDNSFGFWVFFIVQIRIDYLLELWILIPLQRHVKFLAFAICCFDDVKWFCLFTGWNLVLSYACLSLQLPVIKLLVWTNLMHLVVFKCLMVKYFLVYGILIHDGSVTRCALSKLEVAYGIAVYIVFYSLLNYSKKNKKHCVVLLRKV